MRTSSYIFKRPSVRGLGSKGAQNHSDGYSLYEVGGMDKAN